MKVYRWEHRITKVGPYRYSAVGFSARISREHDCSYNHPMPISEDLRVYFGDVCGFASMAAARRWFDGWEKDLVMNDFRFRQYEVPREHIRKGEKQLVYKRSKSKLVADLTEKMVNSNSMAVKPRIKDNV